MSVSVPASDRGRPVRDGRRPRVTVVLVVLLLALSACTTSPTPDATPTASTPPAVEAPTSSEAPGTPFVGVVVVPGARQQAVLEGVRDVVARRDEVRWSVATATRAGLVAGLVGAMVDEGADLVCVVGSETATAVAAVQAVADQVPGGRFCVGPTPAPEEPAAGVLYVDLRIEETAYLAGALAGLVAGPRPAGIVTGRSAYAAARQQRAFEQGLADVGGPAAVSATGPVTDAETAAAAAVAQFGGEVSVVLTDAGESDLAVVEVATAVAAERLAATPSPTPGDGTEPVTDATTDPPTDPADGSTPGPAGPPEIPPTGVVAGPEVLVDDALADVVLAVVRTRPELVLGPAVDRLLQGWQDGVVSVGLVEGAVAFDLASTPLAVPHVDAINVVRGEIAAGDRVVLPDPPG